jgi:MoxR-like ATPase
VIVERMTGPATTAGQVLTTTDLLDLQRQADAVYVDPALHEFAVRLASATRAPRSVGEPDLERYLAFGASPRASINLVLTGRALAFLRGRDYALPQDVLDMAPDVLRHRLVLSYEAHAEDVTPDMLLERIVARVPVPAVPHQRPRDGSFERP